MALSFTLVSFIVILCCILCANVGSKPLYRHQKRNSHSQNVGLRRCGNDDIDSATSLTAEYQYLPDSFAPRLSAQNLSWKITRYPDEIDNHTRVESVNLATNEALNLWSSVTNLHFFHINSGTPDIDIQFQFPKTHNRQCTGVFGFGIIGHYVGGSINPRKIHFNEQNEWTTSRFDSRNDSVNLVNAIAHEVGHLLGFDHTIWPNSVMSKYYPSHVFSAPTVLSSDDISAAKNRYGVKVNSNPITAAGMHYSRGYFVTTTLTSTSAVSATTGDHYCSEQYIQSFNHKEKYSRTVCAVAYELDNCRGGHLTLESFSDVSLYQSRFGKWGSRIASMRIAPNCRAQVCSLVDGNRICPAKLTGTIPSLEGRFDNRPHNVSCLCDACSIPFPIREPDENVCAVAYWTNDCRREAKLFSPGAVWLRNRSQYWKHLSFGSAQVNPNCTVKFCHTETITYSNCLTLSGGARGQSYPILDWIYLSNVVSVHCSCG